MKGEWDLCKVSDADIKKKKIEEKAFSKPSFEAIVEIPVDAWRDLHR